MTTVFEQAARNIQLIYSESNFSQLYENFRSFSRLSLSDGDVLGLYHETLLRFESLDACEFKGALGHHEIISTRELVFSGMQTLLEERLSCES